VKTSSNSFCSIFDLIAAFLAAAVAIFASGLTVPGAAFTLTVSRSRLMHPEWANKSIVTRLGKEVNFMKIDLTIREAPPEGPQVGVFADVIQGETKDKRGKTFKTLTLLGQLVAVNSNGKRFVARKTYKVSDTRGVKKLIGDLKVWRGSDAVPNLDEFDPEAEFLGKPFTCDHSSIEEDGAKVIQIGNFKPNPEAKINAQDYTRKQGQPAPA
jgi:hypothetical protein